MLNIYIFLSVKFFLLFFKSSHKTEELRHEVFFVFFWQLQTRYHIFGLCLGGRPQLEEEERTDAALVFLSAGPHLRRNSVTHLKPSK